MRILVIGSGGREDALVRALARQEHNQVDVAPGNPGMARFAQLHNVDPQDGQAVADLACHLGSDLVVIGPEAPLVAGVADLVRQAGVACFGPSVAAAQLEGSKQFAKQVMQAAGIATAEAVPTTTVEQAAAALDQFGPPYVVKDDGLAAGKGVVVTDNRDLAIDHAAAVVATGRVVLIEEYLDGPEVSLFCISDGQYVLPLAPAQDFKRALDNDLGPNTGGMGAYSPLPWAPANLTAQVVAEVALPAVNEMARRGTPFVGLLYCGLALTSKGLKVVEFNVRFGDPEVQAVLARLETPLDQVLMAAATGRLGDLGPLQFSDQSAICVVVAAQGYPVDPLKGTPIRGIEAAERVPGVAVLQAGTRVAPDGQLVSAGGRVLNVVALGADLTQARERAYQAVALIDLAGSHHRTDIALKAATAA